MFAEIPILVKGLVFLDNPGDGGLSSGYPSRRTARKPLELIGTIMDQRHLFPTSPRDVNHERQLALKVIEQIQSERLYRDRIRLIIVAWDKPGVGTAMSAHLEPQESINRGLKKSSECDIVIVIFWRVWELLYPKNI